MAQGSTHDVVRLRLPLSNYLALNPVNSNSYQK